MSRILENKKNLITQKYKEGVHNGIDIVGDHYSVDNIIAHSSGEVVGIRSDYKTSDKTGNSYGNYVKIKHENGYYTLYAHLKYGSVDVKKGEIVNTGQIIGTMGATGHVTGIHLHFEVRDENDNKIDPTSYINSDLPLNESDDLNEDKTYLLHLVKRTIRGDFGNGQNRARILGDNYDEVQRVVNINMKKGNTTWDSIKWYD